MSDGTETSLENASDDADEWSDAYRCPFCGLPVGMSSCPHAIAYGDDMPEWVGDFENLIPISDLHDAASDPDWDWRTLTGFPYWQDQADGANFIEVLENHPHVDTEVEFWEGVCISGHMHWLTVRSDVRDALHAELREVGRRIMETTTASD